MSKKETSGENIIDMFVPKKSAQDNLLITAAISMIVGSIVLIGIAPSLSKTVRISLAISVGSLTISLFFLLWYNPRLETRCKLMKKATERRIEKAREDMRKFTKLFYVPLFTSRLINNLQELRSNKFKSRKEFKKAIRIAMDKTTEDMEANPKDKNFTTELFYKDFMKDMYFMDEKIFHTPLDEDFSKLKHFIDISSFKLRHHFFVIGVVALAFSIITHLLLK